MILFFFCMIFSLFGCSAPEPAARPEPPVEQSSSPPPSQVQTDLTIDEVRAHKTAIEAAMARQIEKAKTFDGVNPMLIAKAEAQLKFLQEHFVAVSVETTNGGLKIVTVEKCTATDHPEICFGYVASKFSQDEDNNTIASWAEGNGTMVMWPDMPGMNSFGSFIVQHELSHVFDTTNGENRFFGNPMMPGVNVEVPSETMAYMFEGDLLNAATRGKYYQLIERLVEMVHGRAIGFVTVEPGPITFIDLDPKVLDELLGNGSQNNSAEYQAFAILVTIDLNHFMIDQMSIPAEERNKLHRWLYANFVNGLGAPLIQEMIRSRYAPLRAIE
jgi:hypothetical protein